MSSHRTNKSTGKYPTIMSTSKNQYPYSTQPQQSINGVNEFQALQLQRLIRKELNISKGKRAGLGINQGISNRSINSNNSNSLSKGERDEQYNNNPNPNNSTNSQTNEFQNVQNLTTHTNNQSNIQRRLYPATATKNIKGVGFSPSSLLMMQKQIKHQQQKLKKQQQQLQQKRLKQYSPQSPSKHYHQKKFNDNIDNKKQQQQQLTKRNQQGDSTTKNRIIMRQLHKPNKVRNGLCISSQALESQQVTPTPTLSSSLSTRHNKDSKKTPNPNPYIKSKHFRSLTPTYQASLLNNPKIMSCKVSQLQMNNNNQYKLTEYDRKIRQAIELRFQRSEDRDFCLKYPKSKMQQKLNAQEIKGQRLNNNNSILQKQIMQQRFRQSLKHQYISIKKYHEEKKRIQQLQLKQQQPSQPPPQNFKIKVSLFDKKNTVLNKQRSFGTNSQRYQRQDLIKQELSQRYRRNKRQKKQEKEKVEQEHYEEQEMYQQRQRQLQLQGQMLRQEQRQQINQFKQTKSIFSSRGAKQAIANNGKEPNGIDFHSLRLHTHQIKQNSKNIQSQRKFYDQVHAGDQEEQQVLSNLKEQKYLNLSQNFTNCNMPIFDEDKGNNKKKLVKDIERLQTQSKEKQRKLLYQKIKAHNNNNRIDSDNSDYNNNDDNADDDQYYKYKTIERQQHQQKNGVLHSYRQQQKHHNKYKTHRRTRTLSRNSNYSGSFNSNNLNFNDKNKQSAKAKWKVDQINIKLKRNDDDKRNISKVIDRINGRDRDRDNGIDRDSNSNSNRVSGRDRNIINNNNNNNNNQLSSLQRQQSYRSSRLATLDQDGCQQQNNYITNNVNVNVNKNITIENHLNSNRQASNNKNKRRRLRVRTQMEADNHDRGQNKQLPQRDYSQNSQYSDRQIRLNYLNNPRQTIQKKRSNIKMTFENPLTTTSNNRVRKNNHSIMRVLEQASERVMMASTRKPMQSCKKSKSRFQTFS